MINAIMCCLTTTETNLVLPCQEVAQPQVQPRRHLRAWAPQRTCKGIMMSGLLLLRQQA